MQNILRINRQQRVRPAEQNREKVQRDHPQDDPVVEHKMESAHQHLRRNRLLHHRLVMRPHASHQRHANRRRRRIEQIDARRAFEPPDGQPAQRRTNHGRQLKRAGGPVQGPRKFLPRNQLRQKRRAGGPQKSARHARNEQAEIYPPDYPMDPGNSRIAPGNQRQSQRGRRQRRLARHDDPLAAARVGQVSGGQGHHQHGADIAPGR
jgi:hypothetical protein